MYNVLIIDDQRSSRELMNFFVKESTNYNLVGTLEDAEMANSFCKEISVDLVLMDIYYGGKDLGLQVAQLLKKSKKCIKIILVTFAIQEEHIDKAREIGCEGFWYKDYGSIKLIEVMNRVMEGEAVYPDKIPIVNIGLANTSEFTKQELNVLKLKVNGYSHMETCKKLGITRSTLNYHISNLKDKTGYSNLLKLAIDVSSKKFIIAEEGMIEDDEIKN